MILEHIQGFDPDYEHSIQMLVWIDLSSIGRIGKHQAKIANRAWWMWLDNDKLFFSAAPIETDEDGDWATYAEPDTDVMYRVGGDGQLTSVGAEAGLADVITARPMWQRYMKILNGDVGWPVDNRERRFDLKKIMVS